MERSEVEVGGKEDLDILLSNVGPSRHFVLSPPWRRWISKCKQCKQHNNNILKIIIYAIYIKY
jgi:hypothetical protein